MRITTSLWTPLLGVALLGIAQSGAALAQDVSAVQIETVAVADGIFMLVGAGGNIGVSIGVDGVFLIDDQYGAINEKLKAAVARLSGLPIKLVLNTHWHADHTGGNELLAEVGALIVAHDNVRKRMSSTHVSAFFKSETPPSPQAALPVVTFDRTVTLHLNGHTIRIEHAGPAHTDGDAIVFFEEANVVHMGDLFFNGLYPFIDADSGGSIDGMITVLDDVIPMLDDATKVIPGHGPLSDRSGLIEFSFMLRDVRDQIQMMIDTGKSVEAIIAAQPTAGYDKIWGGGFIKPDAWVGLVYDGMTRTSSGN